MSDERLKEIKGRLQRASEGFVHTPEGSIEEWVNSRWDFEENAREDIAWLIEQLEAK